MASKDASHKSPRTVPMEVLCLGLSRSGTEALCKALTILGIPTYHGFNSHKHLRLWRRALDSKYKAKGKLWEREDFDQILAEFNGVTDLPCAMFSIKLMQAYPEAKVILNKRPFEPLWDSWKRTLVVMKESWAFWLICQWDGEARFLNSFWQEFLNIFFFGDLRRNAHVAYQQHYAIVRGAAPKDRFLEWEVTEGWAPLCKFLDRPIPDIPFPSGNAVEEFTKKNDEIMGPMLKRAVRNIAIGSSLAVGLIAYAVYKWRV